MLAERDYMRRDKPRKSTPAGKRSVPTPELERLLKPVKRARLIPANRLIPVFIVGLSIGCAIGFYLSKSFL